MEMTFLPS